MTDSLTSAVSIQVLNSPAVSDAQTSAVSVQVLNQSPPVDVNTSALSGYVLNQSPSIDVQTSAVSFYVLADFIPIPPDVDKSCALYEPVIDDGVTVMNAVDPTEVVVVADMEC